MPAVEGLSMNSQLVVFANVVRDTSVADLTNVLTLQI
jgi:hypothetical protein